MNLFARFCLVSAAILSVMPAAALAEPPTLELMGGLSSPAPGISGSVSSCWRLWHLGCGGISLFGSRNEVTKDDITINATYVTGIMEQSFGLSDEYHLIWVNAVAGVGYYRRKVNDSTRSETESWTKIAPSLGGGAGVELPIADLIGMRFGVLVRKALVSGASAQVAFVAGIRIGSEWLGVGD